MQNIQSLHRRIVQLDVRAPERSPRCPRAVCKRFGWCVPPPDPDRDGLPRCRFEPCQAWEERIPAAWEASANRLRPHKRVWRRLLEKLREDGIELEDEPKASRRRLRRGGRTRRT